ncbi:MAG: FkbM family methyltransferase [Chitinophagales bacterium]
MPDTIIKNDNHQEDIQIIFERLKKFTPTGVFHIGAHKGEEVDQYLALGFQKIILVEADPSLYEYITKKFKKDKNVSVFNYAVCDKVGFVDFYIHKSNNGTESSSIFKMDKLDKIVTSLKTSKTIRVPANTIDNIIHENNINLEDYNVLVSDIQGADYFAIKGAEKSINKFDAVIVEVQCINLYENYISEEKMDSLMKGFGFEKEFVIYHELYKNDKRFPAWGEALYINKNKKNAKLG